MVKKYENNDWFLAKPQTGFSHTYRQFSGVRRCFVLPLTEFIHAGTSNEDDVRLELSLVQHFETLENDECEFRNGSNGLTGCTPG